MSKALEAHAVTLQKLVEKLEAEIERLGAENDDLKRQLAGRDRRLESIACLTGTHGSLQSVNRVVIIERVHRIAMGDEP
jgi:hypothetical protein